MPIKLTENFRAVFYAPFYATQALGFYAREGVEVELLPSPAPAAAAADLLAGNIDLTWGGPMRVMKARDENPNSPLVCFCEVAARDPFFLVGRGDPSAFRLAELPRLRLATVSEVPTPWLCLQQDLRDAGVDPDRLQRVTDRTMADNLEALRKGDLDVVQLFEPYVSMALATGAGQILYAASTPWADGLHDLSRHPREHRPQPDGVYRDGARSRPHGGLAARTWRRRARRRGCAVLSKSRARASGERAAALPRGRAMGDAPRSVAAGLCAPRDKSPLRRLRLADARLRRVRGSEPLLKTGRSAPAHCRIATAARQCVLGRQHARHHHSWR